MPQATKKLSRNAKVAGLKRAAKVTGFNIFGFLLVNAAAIASAFFIGIQFSSEMATLLSLFVGSIAAGIQKSISWTES